MKPFFTLLAALAFAIPAFAMAEEPTPTVPEAIVASLLNDITTNADVKKQLEPLKKKAKKAATLTACSSTAMKVETETDFTVEVFCTEKGSRKVLKLSGTISHMPFPDIEITPPIVTSKKKVVNIRKFAMANDESHLIIAYFSAAK